MVGLKKRGVITAVAGILAAVTITGCSAAPDNDATVVTVGTEKVSYGVANFYARMPQAHSQSRVGPKICSPNRPSFSGFRVR